MTDEIDTSFPERIWAVEGVTEVLSFNTYDQGGTEYVRADLYEAERQRAEKAEAALRLCADALDVAHSEVRHSDAVQAALRQDDEED